MSETKTNPVIIIGAGIVGVSTAIWLLRAGQKVILIDKVKPGSPEAASYGNAGILAACSIAPVTSPGLILKSPKMALNPDFPLFVKWGYLPFMASWLFKYLSHANEKDTRRISQSLTPLTYDSVEQHKALVEGSTAMSRLNDSDYSFAYRSREAFLQDQFTWNIRKEAGFEPEIIEGEAVQEFEPNLSTHFQLLARMRNHGFIASPGAYVAELAKQAQNMGAEIIEAEVKDFEFDNDHVSAVLTDQGKFTCSSAVLTAGVWSKQLMDKLGIKVPVETERGYHIEFTSAQNAPRSPIMISTGKFVATPMGNVLRCAGIVEFGGLKAPPSNSAFKLLRKQVKESFPEFTYESEKTWLGHRPAPSDSLPLIGELKQTGIYTGFGHHHIGLTTGPKTGKILAGLITDQHQNLELKAYDPNRF